MNHLNSGGKNKNKNMSNNKKTNGKISLPEQMEIMRLEVVELELKARFWKANTEIRQYSLEYEQLEKPYAEYVERQQALAQKLKEEKEAQILKLQEELQKEIDKQTEVEVTKTEE